MKNILAAAAVGAVVLVGSVGTSSAAIFYPGSNLGTYSADGSQSFAGGVTGYGKGSSTSFTDTFSFVLDAAATISASVTNSFLGGMGLGNFTLTIADPANNFSLVSKATPDLGLSSQTASFPPGGQFIRFTPGSYTLTISGTSAKSTETYGGSFTVNTVSTVPLPGTVALFGTALAGLGLVGAASRRKSVRTAA